jgi:hypothetical protein
MYKHGVRFERDILSWAFNKFRGTNYSGGTEFHYLTGEDYFTYYGVSGGASERHIVSTRIFGSQSYIISATAAGTAYGTNMTYMNLDNFKNSGGIDLADTYTHYEYITKNATNCTRMDATFGFFDECSFNDNFKFWFTRAICGTASHPTYGSRQLTNMPVIEFVDAFDVERNMELHPQSYSIGSHGTYADDSEGTWCATFVFSGTNGCGVTVYPEDIKYYGSIAYSGLEVIKTEHSAVFFGQKETEIPNGDVIHATIYIEF